MLKVAGGALGLAVIAGAASLFFWRKHRRVTAP
jgi:LPXTG-motif cell wall-anchored protein